MKTQPITRNQVSLEGRALSQALKPILRIIERRNTYPILGMVRLTYAASVLTMTATDLDIEITTHLDVNAGEGMFDICIDPRILVGIARVAGVALVTIERTERLADGLKPTLEPECRVSIGDEASYVLHVFNAETWPTLPGTRGELIDRFTNGSLATMLGKVSAFISTEETSYYLNGVAWQTGDQGKRFIATDGHRLGAYLYDADKGGAAASRIIPRKTVALLQALTAGKDATVYSLGERAALDITFDRTTIRTKLIEGTFPDVDRVTPALSDDGHKLALNRLDILSALDRVMVIRERFSTAIRWFERDGKVAVSVKGTDTGNATAVTSAEAPEGMPEFGLNATYIRDMLGRCQGDVVLHFKDGGSPFRITDEDEAMTRVLMPMRF